MQKIKKIDLSDGGSVNMKRVRMLHGSRGSHKNQSNVNNAGERRRGSRERIYSLTAIHTAYSHNGTRSRHW